MARICKTSALLACAAALAIPAAAASADVLPKDAPKCQYTIPHSIPLSVIAHNGLPVRVTCDADATVSSLVDLVGKVGRDWDDAHHHNIPGIALPEDTKVKAGVPAVTRVRITKQAAKFLSRYNGPRIRVLPGELMPDGYYQSVDSGKRIVLR